MSGRLKVDETTPLAPSRPSLVGRQNRPVIQQTTHFSSGFNEHEFEHDYKRPTAPPTYASREPLMSSGDSSDEDHSFVGDSSTNCLRSPWWGRVKVTAIILVVVVCLVVFIVNDEYVRVLHRFTLVHGKDQSSAYSCANESDTDRLLEINLYTEFATADPGPTTQNLTLLVSTGNRSLQTLVFAIPDALNEIVAVTEKYSRVTIKCNEPINITFQVTVDYHVTLSFGLHSMHPIAEYDWVLAGCVILLLYLLILFEVVNRTLAAWISAMAALAVMSALNQRPSLETVMEWIDFETLSLLFGMMLLVAIFCETGFFDYAARMSFRLAKGRVWPLITILCVFTGVVSAFLDNVTTILLIVPVTIKLCEVLHIDAKFILIAMVIFSNIGGTATAIGDPPNVIIVSNSVIAAKGIDFFTFTLHMTVGVVFCFIGGYFFIRILYRCLGLDYSEESRSSNSATQELRREAEIWRMNINRIPPFSREEKTVRALLNAKLVELQAEISREERLQVRQQIEDYEVVMAKLTAEYRITDWPLLWKSSCVLGVVIIAFFAHSFLEGIIHITLGWIALLGALSLLVLYDKHELDGTFQRVEWATLVFFAALFVLMEAMTELGLIDKIGEQTVAMIEAVHPDYQLTVAIVLILWVSAIVSSFIDNIPFTTAMIPIIIKLEEDESIALPLQPLVWALAFGACLGGNGTLIGASANVVCAGIAEQNGYKFTFLEFAKVGFPMMLVTTAIATVYLLICHVGFEWNGPIS